jgi:hypothetical protein
MVTEFFRLPSNTPLVFDGEQKISIAQKGMGGKCKKWQ